MCDFNVKVRNITWQCFLHGGLFSAVIPTKAKVGQRRKRKKTRKPESKQSSKPEKYLLLNKHSIAHSAEFSLSFLFFKKLYPVSPFSHRVIWDLSCWLFFCFVFFFFCLLKLIFFFFFFFFSKTESARRTQRWSSRRRSRGSCECKRRPPKHAPSDSTRPTGRRGLSHVQPTMTMIMHDDEPTRQKNKVIFSSNVSVELSFVKQNACCKFLLDFNQKSKSNFFFATATHTNHTHTTLQCQFVILILTLPQL